jgi:hypothetical protein
VCKYYITFVCVNLPLGALITRRERTDKQSRLFVPPFQLHRPWSHTGITQTQDGASCSYTQMDIEFSTPKLKHMNKFLDIKFCFKGQRHDCLVSQPSANSMETSPSSGSASRWATKKFHNIFSNMKVHCHVQKSPPLIPVLSQIDTVHIAPSYYPTIHLNIILLTISGSSQLFL